MACMAWQDRGVAHSTLRAINGCCWCNSLWMPTWATHNAAAVSTASRQARHFLHTHSLTHPLTHILSHPLSHSQGVCKAACCTSQVICQARHTLPIAMLLPCPALLGTAPNPQSPHTLSTARSYDLSWVVSKLVARSGPKHGTTRTRTL